jgi:hypothetical protein
MCTASRIDVPRVEIVNEDKICPPVIFAAFIKEIIHNFGIYRATSHKWHDVHDQNHGIAYWDHI